MRQKLEDTAPETVETRDEFLGRLRRTMEWMNENWREDARRLATNQKDRAKAVLELRGARTQW